MARGKYSHQRASALRKGAAKMDPMEMLKGRRIVKASTSYKPATVRLELDDGTGYTTEVVLVVELTVEDCPCGIKGVLRIDVDKGK